jgi:hypothetical protein
LGLGTTDHAVPFHDSTSVAPEYPTAVHDVAETQETLVNAPPPVGVGMSDHDAPFHDSANV